MSSSPARLLWHWGVLCCGSSGNGAAPAASFWGCEARGAALPQRDTPFLTQCRRGAPVLPFPCLELVPGGGSHLGTSSSHTTLCRSYINSGRAAVCRLVPGENEALLASGMRSCKGAKKKTPKPSWCWVPAGWVRSGWPCPCALVTSPSSLAGCVALGEKWSVLGPE